MIDRMDLPAAPYLRLMYASRARKGMSDLAVDKLLHVAETNNLRDQITGALLAYGDRFLQVLEGPPDEVEACFNRILADPRHDDVQVLQRMAVDTRQFGPWAMRHVSMDQAREPAVAGFLAKLGHQPSDGDVHLALALLRRLAEPPPPATR
jgi:Sensors of blue-light using FAD